MCGIAGGYAASGLDPAPFEGMLASLTHRGPDESGLKSFGTPSKPYAMLGARRLAIVDVASGQQPVSDPSGRYWVALNGEVYNHHQLRREMSAAGVETVNASDTALVASILTAMPLDRALSRLQGMFAISILDTQTQTLTLVRDRMGVKPLYWCEVGDTVLWGSELKALHRHPALPRRLNDAAVRAYLMFEYIPSPWSIWADVEKLEPGCLIQVTPQGVTRRRWWTPPTLNESSGGSLPKWAVSIRGALGVAVNCRMEADVPVGYLLSGGLDSSLIAALAANQQQEPIHTFSMKVDAPGFDESDHAATVAASLGAQHHTGTLTAADLPGILDRITASLDEPLADSSLVATWALMAMVQEAGLKCVLSGDGADESFAGYPTYLAHRLARFAGPVRGVLSGALSRLPVRHEGVTADYKARRFLDGLDRPWARRHQVWMGAWLPEEVSAQDSDWAIVADHASRAGQDPVTRAMVLDQRLYLPEGVLVKVDRASMAHGVEVRSPFLDYRLVELAADVPPEMKRAGLQSKIVLRAVAKDLLPAATLKRRKKGFGTPVGPWLRGPCQGLLDGLPEALEDWISPEVVQRCITEHRDGTADHRRRLWSGIILARWRAGPWGM
ncbi:MAG: asparagine synthase (glutamine-hydrolyzing) [Myxococcota bacterium]|jgi:asparagine synthase (glutamine-hydrolysing)